MLHAFAHPCHASAQTEQYIEYDRSGSVVNGQEKQVVRSKYDEDVFAHNHTAIWGSFFDLTTFRWGYEDDHATVRNSYSTGMSGKLARMQAVAALSEPVEAAASTMPPPPARLAASSNAALGQRALYGAGADLDAEAPLDESKVRAAMAAQKANASAKTSDERKRKYNSMSVDDTSAEGMEAYYRNKSRDNDPMAKLMSNAGGGD